MRAAAADVVLILGDIGEMREKAEGADDLHRLAARQRVERVFELLARRAVLVAAEADRALPDALDGVEGRGAALLAHRVAEDAAEQPDVLAQRQILVVALVVVRGLLLSTWAQASAGQSPGSAIGVFGHLDRHVCPCHAKPRQISAISR